MNDEPARQLYIFYFLSVSLSIYLCLTVPLDFHENNIFFAPISSLSPLLSQSLSISLSDSLPRYVVVYAHTHIDTHLHVHTYIYVILYLYTFIYLYRGGKADGVASLPPRMILHGKPPGRDSYRHNLVDRTILWGACQLAI